MAVGEFLQPREVVARSDRALRIGGRGDEHRNGSGQRRIVERVQIRQESVGERGRQVDQFATGGAGARAIGWIKRVGHQDRGFSPARADITGSGDRGKKQPFAAAVQHQDFALGIDRARQVEPGGQPVCGGAPEWFDALGKGIAAEISDVFRQYRPDEVRHRVLRFP